MYSRKLKRGVYVEELEIVKKAIQRNEHAFLQLMQVEIKIYPLRVALTMRFDEGNDMVFLQFKDLRLEDEKGEEWSSIRNGSMGFGGVGDLEKTYFLQSNYLQML